VAKTGVDHLRELSWEMLSGAPTAADSAATHLRAHGVPRAAHADIAGMNVAQLRDLAARLGYRGLSHSRREDLLRQFGVQ
jgi:hypothetical protein